MKRKGDTKQDVDASMKASGVDKLAKADAEFLKKRKAQKK